MIKLQKVLSNYGKVAKKRKEHVYIYLYVYNIYINIPVRTLEQASNLDFPSCLNPVPSLDCGQHI